MTFTVQGDPKPQPRPRAFAFKGHARVYDAGTAEGWKSLIAVELRKHWSGRMLTGPIHVDLIFFMRRPKSHFRSSGDLKPTAQASWHCQKPDVDNLAKAVLDCLSQCGVWKDDAQVVSLAVNKEWDVTPRCVITLVDLNLEGGLTPTPQPHVAD